MRFALNMRAVILAAGLGNRLRPLTDHLPKPVVPFMNRPLFVSSLECLQRAGCTEVILNAHHMRDVLIAHAEPWLQRSGLRYTFSIEDELRGTGGGIHAAFAKGEALWGAPKGPLLVMNGDVCFAPDLRKVTRFHEENQALATMVLVEHADAHHKGAVYADDGRVTQLAGDGAPIGRPYLFTGTHVLSREMLDKLPQSGCVVRQGYVPNRSGIRAWISADPFWDLGTPRDYLRAHRWSLEQRGASTLVGEGAVVAAKATHSVMGANAAIHAPIEGCVVWPYTVVTQSYRNAILAPEFQLVVDDGA